MTDRPLKTEQNILFFVWRIVYFADIFLVTHLLLKSQNFQFIYNYSALALRDLLISRKMVVICELQASFWSDSQSVRDTERPCQRRWTGAVRPQSATLLESLLVSRGVPWLRLQHFAWSVAEWRKMLLARAAVDLQPTRISARFRQLPLPYVRCDL